MTMHRLVLAFALSGASLYGCGSDPTPNDPVTIPPPDAGVTGKLDAATTTPPSSDAARPDAAVAADAGAPRSDGGNVDSGARDSGTLADSGKAQDSGPGAVDSGAPPTVDSGMSIPATGDPRSAACLKCEMTECDAKKWPNTDFTFNTCSDFGTETAKAGMGTGKLKSALCEDALTCMRNTRCADPIITLDAMGAGTNPDVSRCICGQTPFNDCIGAKNLGSLTGPCRDKLADAAETDDIQTLMEYLQNPELASGAAARRMICGQNLCADECYAPCANQPDGTACAGADIGIASNAPTLQNASGMVVPDVPKQGACNMKSCVDFYSVRYNGSIVK